MSETGSDQGRQVQDSGSKKGWVWLLVMPVIGGLLGYFCGAVMAYVAPKKYESVTVLQVLPAVGDDGVSGQHTNPNFIATQFAVMTAEQTLKHVVDRLDLTSRWKQDESTSIKIIQGITEAEQIRGTDLLEVRVRHTNANDARDIAGAIAEAYIKRRRDSAMGQAQVALDALDDEIRDQEDLVEEKRKILDTIVQAIGIPYVEGEASVGGGAISNYEAEYERSMRSLYELEIEVKEREAQLKEVEGMADEDLMAYVLSIDEPPGGVMERRKEYLVEKKLLELMKAQSGTVDEEVMLRQMAKVAVAEEEFRRTLGAWREISKTQLGIMKKRMERLLVQVNKARDNAVDRSLESHDFVEAKREYEATQAMLQKMKLEHSSRRIGLRIPKNLVSVHEEAKTGRAPVSPDVEILLSTGLWIGVGTGLLFGLFFCWLGRLGSQQPTAGA